MVEKRASNWDAFGQQNENKQYYGIIHQINSSYL